MKHLRGKVRLLFMKLTSLEKEVEESRQILTSAAKEVDSIFIERYFPETKQEGSPPPTLPTEQGQQVGANKEKLKDEDLQSAIDMDPEVKKVFRRIATKVHPDKLSDNISQSEKEKKIEMFQQALRASEQNDFVTLAHIAIDIGVDLPDIPPEAIKKTEEKIYSLKKEIKRIESTYVWQWYFCSDLEKKEQILNDLLRLMYEKATKNSGA